MKPTTKVSVIIIIVAIIALSILDLAANVFSGVPILGPMIETATESVLEISQIALAGLLGMIATRRSP